jgi:N-acetyl-beta-hexosaminidase
MLDPCRPWMPVEMVKRNLEATAAVKLNVLHWHLSEDQAFRVESRRYPRLHQMGRTATIHRSAHRNRGEGVSGPDGSRWKESLVVSE